MAQGQSIAMKQHLQQIADMLLLNGALVDCPGLIHGKTGIAVFFFHYARHAGNELFEDYAMELIEEIQEQIYATSPADYEQGIAGIGTGIDYLIQNDFLAVGPDIFEDFDKRMYRAVMYDPWQDFSLYDGSTGYGRYWIHRLNKQAENKQAQEALEHILNSIGGNTRELTEQEQIDIFCFLRDLCTISPFTERVVTLMIQFNHVHHMEKGPFENNDPEQYFSLLQEMKPAGMGLWNGYAGLGLCLLNRLGVTNDWMNLL